MRGAILFVGGMAAGAALLYVALWNSGVLSPYLETVRAKAPAAAPAASPARSTAAPASPAVDPSHRESSAGIKEGMQVARGTVIGFVGSTGNAHPEAPHLHLAIFPLGPEKQWWKGTGINPYPILMEALREPF